MLVKKNKACEAMENILGFRFEELEFVGKYNNIIDSDFLTTIYKRDKELYIAQLCRDKIFVISQIIEICRGLNTKMTKNFSIKDKEYSYTYKEIAIIFSSKDKKYSIFVNDEEKYIVDEKLTIKEYLNIENKVKKQLKIVKRNGNIVDSASLGSVFLAGS